MAPASVKQLLARQYYNNNNNCAYNGYCDDYSPWYSYGRWIVLAAIILAAFLLFLSCSCVTARRRRRRGLAPYRGTGWAAGQTPAGHAPAQWAGNAPQPYYGNNNAQAPPAYGQPQQQQTGGGFFGGAGTNHNQQQQQQGVELQQPDHTYQRGGATGGENVYAPPQGPPPGKTADGIIR